MKLKKVTDCKSITFQNIFIHLNLDYTGVQLNNTILFQSIKNFNFVLSEYFTF